MSSFYIRNNHHSSQSLTNALMLASCHPDWRAKEKFWKVVQRQKTTATFQRLHCWVEMEQDKANTSTGFFTHITRSLECVLSIFCSTGSMRSGSFTSTEQQIHLTKSPEKFSPASYDITILIVSFQKNTIHTKPTWIIISDVNEVVEAL